MKNNNFTRKLQIRKDIEQRLATLSKVNPNLTYLDIIKIYGSIYRQIEENYEK